MTAPQPTQSRRDAEAWTTRRLLAWMGDAFGEASLDSPRLCAEMLLAHTLGCERLALYTDADRPASSTERAALRDLVRRALRHEPVQQLVGEAWFYGLPLEVNRDTLIPRPSTETLVGVALEHFAAAGEAPAPPLLADVGVGSGAIAISMLKNLPDAFAVASDISAGALDVARRNASRHGVADRISFEPGDLLGPALAWCESKGRGLDALLSNPPYIPDHEWASVAPNVRLHEPETALRGGEDGLQFVRPLIEQAPRALASDGLLAIEIAASTADAARAIAADVAELIDVAIHRDDDGLERVLTARRA